MAGELLDESGGILLDESGEFLLDESGFLGDLPFPECFVIAPVICDPAFFPVRVICDCRR